MATGGETKFSCCSSCLDNGRNITARHYCVDCEMYFCTKCVDCHKTIPALKKHLVNDVNSTDSTDAGDDSTSLQNDVPSDSINRLSCTLHQGKVIDLYCEDHGEVCCASCAVVKHRPCTTLSIAIAAKDFKSSSDMNKLKEALTENLVQCKQEKEKRADNLYSIGKQKQELIEEVDKYELKVIARIKELANISRNEIRSKYEEHKTLLETDIESLDVVIATITEFVERLEQSDDEHVFVYAKTNKTVTKDGEILLQAMMKDWKERGLLFCFDQMLEKHVLGMKSLGKLQDPVTEYQATFQSNLNVQQSNDSLMQIFDICLIDPNDLLLTDYHNEKLKRFNSDLQFKDEIALSGSPCAVCKTDKHEVAVRIRNTKVVHIVSVRQSMHLTSSFSLADNGWGMTSNAGSGELFACEENKVSVYSKTGTKLRTYEKDGNGDQMFLQCRQITLSMNKQDIYVTDNQKGLIILNKNGTFKLKISLSDAWSLCILPGDICLTGGNASAVIIQIDKDGKQVGNLIDTNNGRTYTYCAVYDCEKSRLIVGGYPSLMAVYTLSAKYK